MLKTVDRFILREVALSLGATLVVLLAIVLASRLANYLTQVANGLLVKEVILRMLVLQSIRFLPVLVPIAFLLGIMLTLGRLYQDSEMVALTACGYGPGEIYRPLLLLALPLLVLLLLISLWVAPAAATLQFELQARARQQAQVSVFNPGTFREAANGRHVVYVAALDPASNEMLQVFIQSRESDGGVAITTGDRGHQEVDAAGNRFMVLYDGYRYEGRPDALDYQVSRFDRLRVKLEAPPTEAIGKREGVASGRLLGGSRQDLAELHGRLGGPVSVLLIAFVAPLLARARPRENRYGRVLGAILVYAVYINLLGIGKAWLEKGTLGPLVGLWWVHALLALLALGLWWRYYGFRSSERVEVPA